MVVRGVGFLAFWVILIGPRDLVAGLLAAAAATWASVHLLPPGALRPRPAAIPALVVRFMWLSVVAGWDVARRALDPRLPVNPGFVAYQVSFPPGAARNVFTALTSLLPGSVPAGDDGDTILYHCLDVAQPVLEQLAAEEAVLSRALGVADRDV